MKTVITYGTFDLLHIGHINLLQRAKALGDKLIVALSTDEFNAKMKSKHCIQPYAERKLILESLLFVDMVIPEESWEQKVDDVQKHDVDVFVIGKDWEGKFDFLKTQCDVVYLERTEGVSTTERKNQIAFEETKICSSSADENCAVVLGITDNLVFAAANVIIGLKRHSPTFIKRIIIYSDYISDSNKESLSKIHNDIIYILFTKDDFLSRMEGLTAAVFDNFITRYSHLPFAKFEMFNLLSEYSCLLWLDVDSLVQKDLSDIISFKPIAWRPVRAYDLYKRAGKMYPIIEQGDTSPIGGILFASNQLREFSTFRESCYEILANLITDGLVGGLDEMPIAITSKMRNCKVNNLDYKYNALPTTIEADDAYVVHSSRDNKFWNDNLLRRVYGEWSLNNDIWMRLGGSQYEGSVINSKEFRTNRECIFSLSNAIFWKGLLSKYHNDIPGGVIQSPDIMKSYLQFYIPNVDRKIHFELSKIQKAGYLNVAVHCEDKIKKNDPAWKKLFNQIEGQSSVLNLNYIYNIDDEGIRLEVHNQVPEEMALEALRSFVIFVIPMITAFVVANQDRKKKPCQGQQLKEAIAVVTQNDFANKIRVIKAILESSDADFFRYDYILSCVNEFGVFPFKCKEAIELNLREKFPAANFTNPGLLQVPTEFAQFCTCIATLNIASAIELGVFKGFSSYFLCAILYRANPNLKYTMVDIQDRLESFDEFCALLPLQKVIPSTSDDYIGQAYDFVFIDADHKYEPSLRDYLNVGKFAKKCVAFHDIYSHEYDKFDGGTVRTWKEFTQMQHEFSMSTFSDFPDQWMGIGVGLRRN